MPLHTIIKEMIIMNNNDKTEKSYQGSVILIKQNTRHPYMARRYKGRNQNGKPEYLYLGSYATRAEAEVLRNFTKNLECQAPGLGDSDSRGLRNRLISGRCYFLNPTLWIRARMSSILHM